jgi:hypothetical protein
VEALLEVIEPATKQTPVEVDDSRPAFPSATVVIPSQAA